jgi:hypothetical protein
LGSQILFRIGFEFLHAGSAAKVVNFSAVVVGVLGGGRVHAHSAYRVAFELRGWERGHFPGTGLALPILSLRWTMLYIGFRRRLAGARPTSDRQAFRDHSMTYLDVVFRYGASPGEAELRAIDGMREVYGVRRVNFDERERTVRVEFDASRMKPDSITKLLRQAGIDVRERLATA